MAKIGKILGSLAGTAAPFLSMIPGWGPLAGAAAGAVSGGLLSGKGKPQETGTITKTESSGPPSWQEEYWKNYLADTSALAKQPYPTYTGQRVADLSAPQLAAIDLAMRRATEGAPDINQARGMTQEFMGGQYLANPFLGENAEYTNKVIGDVADQMTRSFKSGTAAQNDALANRMGAYGGSQWANKQTQDAEALARQIGAMGNQYQLARSALGAGDYRSGTGQMLTAGQLAGNLSQEDYRAMEAAAAAGGILQGQEQKKLSTAYDDYMAAQLWPYLQSDRYGNALQRAGQVYKTGTGTATTTEPGSSIYTDIMGGALAGAAAGGLFGRRPGNVPGQAGTPYVPTPWGNPTQVTWPTLEPARPITPYTGPYFGGP